MILPARLATIADADLIAGHRHAMFTEIGKSDPEALVLMRQHFAPWVQGIIAAGRYVGWVVEDEGRAVASAGFLHMEWPPHPLDPTGVGRGYLLNFWVEPTHRRQGLARNLVREALAESRRRGLRVTALHASKMGRPVYEAVGFRSSVEMLHWEPANESPAREAGARV